MAGSGRAPVVGVATADAATAYPFESVESAGYTNDVIGEKAVVIANGPGVMVIADSRRVECETVRFRRANERTLVPDGSRWLIDRELAVAGPHEAVQLRRTNDVPPLFRFACVDFHPAMRMDGAES